MRKKAIITVTVIAAAAAVTAGLFYTSKPKAPVTDPDFSSKRLLVSMADGSAVDDTHVVSSYNGLYALSYDTAEEAKEAYAAFEAEGCTILDTDGVFVDADARQSKKRPAFETDTEALKEAGTVSDDTYGESVIAVVGPGAVESENVIDAISVTGENQSDEDGEALVSDMLEENPDAKVVSIQAVDKDGRGSSASMYAGIETAVSKGADIIVLPVSTRDLPGADATDAAIEDAVSKGITVVGAAGTGDIESSYTEPGKNEHAIIVGACKEDGSKRWNSNYGQTMDYLVVADDTAEAAAKMAGYLSCHDTVIPDGSLIYKKDGTAEPVDKEESSLTPAGMMRDLNTGDLKKGTAISFNAEVSEKVPEEVKKASEQYGQLTNGAESMFTLPNDVQGYDFSVQNSVTGSNQFGLYGKAKDGTIEMTATVKAIDDYNITLAFASKDGKLSGTYMFQIDSSKGQAAIDFADGGVTASSDETSADNNSTGTGFTSYTDGSNVSEVSRQEQAQSAEYTLSTDSANFDSRRLLVKADPEDIRNQDEIAGAYKNVYLLQFDSIEETKQAYTYYEKQGNKEETDNAFVIASALSNNVFSDVTEESNPMQALVNTINSSDTDNEKKIAVIDTGAKADAKTKLVSMLGDDGLDENGHGTEVVNMIREQAPDAEILSIKAFDRNGYGSASTVYAAIQYAIQQNATVINLSFSGYSNPSTSLIKDAIEEAISSGCTVVGAAGNKGADVSEMIPGGIEEVYVAGACDENGKKLENSNYGSTVDINVVADSTSMAAAKLSGFLFANGKIQDVNKNGLFYSTDYTGAEEDDKETSDTDGDVVQLGVYTNATDELLGADFAVAAPSSLSVYKIKQNLNFYDYGCGIGLSQHYVNGSNASLYCVERVTDSTGGTYHSTGVYWSNAAKAAAAYVLGSGQHYRNQACAYSKYATGDNSRDYAVTQMAIWAVLNHYGIRIQAFPQFDAGFTINYREVTKGTHVKEKATALYNDAISYANSHPGWTTFRTPEETISSPSNIEIHQIDSNTFATDAYTITGIYGNAPGVHLTGDVPSGAYIQRLGDTTDGYQFRVVMSTADVTKLNRNYSFQIESDAAQTEYSANLYRQSSSTQALGYAVGSSVTNSNPARANVRIVSQAQLEKTSTSWITSGNSHYSLAGAVYAVYSGNRQVATLTTDANGHAGPVRLDAGTYTVKEIKAPKGFKLNTDPITLKITGGTTTLKTQDHPYLHGHVKVSKIDKNSGKNITGAVFTLYKNSISAANKIEDLRETSTGVYQSSELYEDEIGTNTLYVVETKAPTAHQAAFSQKVVFNENTVEYSYTAVNDNAPVWIYLDKRNYENHDEKVPGATFMICEYNVDKKGYDDPSIKMEWDDESGVYKAQVTYTAKNLGRFRIVETKAPDKFWTMDPFDFSYSSEALNASYTYTKYEYPVQQLCQVKLKKLDSEKPNDYTLSDAIFNIYEWNEEKQAYETTPLCQAKWNPDTEMYESPVFKMYRQGKGERYVNGQKIEDSTYPGDLATYGHYNMGKFLIKEDQWPDGYIDTKYTRELQFTWTDQEKVTEVNPIGETLDSKGAIDVNNIPTTVYIKKVNADGTPLVGAKFKVGRTDSRRATDVEYTTDKNGIITLKRLKRGQYRYYETEAPVGYWRDKTMRYFTIGSDGMIDGKNEVTFSHTNYATYPYTITKKDSDGNTTDIKTGFPAGTVFSIYEYSREAGDYKAETYCQAGYHNGKFIDDATLETVMLNYTPDNQGKFKIEEVKATPGYILDKNPQYVTILAVYKPDQTYSVEFSNRPNSFTISKTDMDGKKLSGIHFQIWRDGHEGETPEYNDLVTDQNGKITVSGLKPGIWYYKETQTLAGMGLDSTVYQFIVADDSTIDGNTDKQVVLINSRKPQLEVIKNTDDVIGDFPDGTEFYVYAYDEETGEYESTPYKKLVYHAGKLEETS